ncbi:AbrB/MazE/SpoVT family DNA-binding domain-containing protein [soil metagenome]
MKISKWGNSLAIRLPVAVVEKLGVKEGDEIDEIPGAPDNTVVLKRRLSRKELLARLEDIRKTSPIPADYKFKRADAYDDEY